MARNISQNKPFNGLPNNRRGSGPVYYTWTPQPFEKRGRLQQNIPTKKCDNTVDNVTTYVYDILPNGDHLSYVYCDYVV